MAQPNPPVHIPGLITTAGTTTPPLPAPAQPGAALPPGTVTPGVIPPVPQVAAQGPNVPALPQAGGVLAPVQIDPAVAAAYLASMQSQPPTAQPVAPVAPAPAAAPTPYPVLPTAVVPQPPAPVSVPGLAAPVAVPAAQPVAPAPAAQPPASATEPDGLTDGDGKDYPEGKPLTEMTDGERANYYKWYSRQHENRAKASKTELDTLRAQLAQGQTPPVVPAPAATNTPIDLDARIAAAIQEGYQQAAAAAAVTLVDAHVRAGLQTRLQPHQVEALASGLNHAHFLGADGRSVDADKVATFVNTVAPAPTPATAVPAVTASPAPANPGALPTSVPVPGQPVTGLPRPDLGQGVQPAAPLDKFELGRQQARAFLAGNL
jgi:hypothetical protein